MDLRSIANRVSNSVNPNMIVSVKASTGYTVGDGYKQIPTYATPVSGPAQLQALDSLELKKIEGLNIEGVLRSIHIRGALAGVIRPNSTGGDLVIIAAPAPVMYRGTWLVVKVFEQWPLWANCAICLQEPGS